MGIYDEGLVDSTGRFKLYRKGIELWLTEDEERGVIGWRMRDMDHIQELEYHDFNGGRPELILTWQSQSGNSGWRGGMAEQHKEVVIYDLENLRVLLHLTQLIFTETWYMQYLEDLDSVDMDTITPVYGGSDEYCEEYLISIRDSIIDVTPVYDKECRGIEPEEKGEKLKLVWRSKAFYLKD